jgi:predicted GNAT family N-acyltransferase
MSKSQVITIRVPKLSELGQIRTLRHEELVGDAQETITYEPTPADLNSTAIHMAAFDGDEVISAVRIDPIVDQGGVFLVSRMVTRDAYRGQGIGAEVLIAAEAAAIKAGAKSFILDSRPKAEQFYTRLGYNRSDSTDLFVVQDVLMTKSVV